MTRAVTWGDGRRERFVDWIDAEVTNAIGARQGLERRWRTWLELYRAPADQPLKRFPFEGASNLMLPVIATDVDQLYARFMQTIHAPDNLWTIAPLNEDWVSAAKPMQDFLQLIDHRLLKMYNVNKRALLEMAKLGTAIYKTHWHYEDRMVGNSDLNGPPIVRRLRSRPVVDHVRLADFLLPPSAVALNIDEQGGAEWTGERLRLHPSILQGMAEASEPVLPNFGKAWVALMVAHAEQTPTEHRQKIQQLDYDKRALQSISFDKSSESDASSGGGIGRVTEIELWEIHARCETQANVWNDIVVWYHRGTRTMGREVLADSAIPGRPYDVIRYFPGDGFYGIGVAEQMEMFQRSQSDTFNFLMDNMLLGNSIGIAAKSGSMIGPGEPIYPGMVKITDGDPRAEFMPFKLGDINPGIGQTLGILQQLGQRRDGVGDLQQGQIEDVPGRTTATTVLSLMQEGSRRPDLTIKDLRYEGISGVGMKTLQLLQSHIGRPEDQGAQTYLKFAVETLGLPEGLEVAKKLAVPMESVEMGLSVALTATSASANKEVEQRRLTETLQMSVAAADKILGYMQIAATQPVLAPIAVAAANGVKELITRYLEQQDVRNLEAIVPAGPIPPPPPPILGPAGMAAGPEGDGGGSGGAAPPQPGGGGAAGGAGPPVSKPNGNAGGGPPPR